MSRPIRLHRVGLDGQFSDDAGRLWVVNDTRKPGSNPPEGSWQRGGREPYCMACGGPLGVVTYFRQRAFGAAACEPCVEVVDPDAAKVATEGHRRLADASEER